nr:hypothetical protein [Tanacetum cinerariifolium]
MFCGSSAIVSREEYAPGPGSAGKTSITPDFVHAGGSVHYELWYGRSSSFSSEIWSTIWSSPRFAANGFSHSNSDLCLTRVFPPLLSSSSQSLSSSTSFRIVTFPGVTSSSENSSPQPVAATSSMGVLFRGESYLTY